MLLMITLLLLSGVIEWKLPRKLIKSIWLIRSRNGLGTRGGSSQQAEKLGHSQLV